MQLEMSQMKKTRALVVLSFSVAIGAAIASCMSFSSGSDNGNKGHRWRRITVARAARRALAPAARPTRARAA